MNGLPPEDFLRVRLDSPAAFAPAATTALSNALQPKRLAIVLLETQRRRSVDLRLRRTVREVAERVQCEGSACIRA